MINNAVQSSFHTIIIICAVAPALPIRAVGGVFVVAFAQKSVVLQQRHSFPTIRNDESSFIFSRGNDNTKLTNRQSFKRDIHKNLI